MLYHFKNNTEEKVVTALFNTSRFCRDYELHEFLFDKLNSALGLVLGRFLQS
jgi:hypothetical protein